jgi:hypothetical protein
MISLGRIKPASDVNCGAPSFGPPCFFIKRLSRTTQMAVNEYEPVLKKLGGCRIGEQGSLLNVLEHFEAH